jgi:hypothetical protein
MVTEGVNTAADIAMKGEGAVVAPLCGLLLLILLMDWL